jgi:hypothetical protein
MSQPARARVIVDEAERRFHGNSWGATVGNERRTVMKLSLDHISLEVNHVGRHKEFIESNLGFILNEDNYIFLDRWYIEVWSPDETTASRSKFPNSTFFFLRANSFDTLLQERESRQLPLKEPVDYVSPRGSVWHDVAFDVSGLEDLLPIIVQPLRPEEMVKAWPFPLKEAHPNGLQSIAACYLMTGRYDDLIQVFSNLLDQPKPTWQENHFFETEQVTFRLSNEELIICKSARSVLAQTFLGPEGEGLFALTFKSGDLQRTHRFFSERGSLSCSLILMQSYAKSDILARRS